MEKKFIFIIILSVLSPYTFSSNLCIETLQKIKTMPSLVYKKLDRGFIPKDFKSFDHKVFGEAKAYYLESFKNQKKYLDLKNDSIEHKLAYIEAITHKAGLITTNTPKSLKKASSRQIKQLKSALKKVDLKGMNSEQSMQRLIEKLYVVTHQPQGLKTFDFIQLSSNNRLRKIFNERYQENLYQYGIYHYLDFYGKVRYPKTWLTRFKNFTNTNLFKAVNDIAFNTTLLSQIKVIPPVMSRYQFYKITHNELTNAYLYGTKELGAKLFTKFKGKVRLEVINNSLQRMLWVSSSALALYTYLNIADVDDTSIDETEKIIKDILENNLKELLVKARELELEVPLR